MSCVGSRAGSCAFQQVADMPTPEPRLYQISPVLCFSSTAGLTCGRSGRGRTIRGRPPCRACRRFARDCQSCSGKWFGVWEHAESCHLKLLQSQRAACSKPHSSARWDCSNRTNAVQTGQNVQAPSFMHLRLCVTLHIQVTAAAGASPRRPRLPPVLLRQPLPALLCGLRARQQAGCRVTGAACKQQGA